MGYMYIIREEGGEEGMVDGLTSVGRDSFGIKLFWSMVRYSQR